MAGSITNTSASPDFAAAAGTAGGAAESPKGTSGSEQKSFSAVWNDIQAKYGEKPKPPREIKKTLGKDDFLKLMITQMKNQDPTKPFDADKMAQEMAQITSVEQLQNINQALNQLGAKNQPLERMAMIGLIGKTIQVDRNRLNHVQGEAEVLRFDLPKDAGEVKVQLLAPDGEVIFEKDMAQVQKGTIDVPWDGKKKNAQLAKSGTYLIQVAAKTAQGAQIAIQTKGDATIQGVTFEGMEPAFLVDGAGKGPGKGSDKVLLSQVTKIENASALEKSTMEKPTVDMANLEKSVSESKGGDHP